MIFKKQIIIPVTALTLLSSCNKPVKYGPPVETEPRPGTLCNYRSGALIQDWKLTKFPLYL